LQPVFSQRATMKLARVFHELTATALLGETGGRESVWLLPSQSTSRQKPMND
jgi:hypothetical protein